MSFGWSPVVSSEASARFPRPECQLSDVIRLRDLRFFAILGDLPHERVTPQPVEIDVEIVTDVRAAGKSDRLEDALDYRTIHRSVAEAFLDSDGEAPHLVEALCERIAERVLALDGVERARIRCRKPWALLPGPAAGVEIEIERP